MTPPKHYFEKGYNWMYIHTQTLTPLEILSEVYA